MTTRAVKGSLLPECCTPVATDLGLGYPRATLRTLARSPAASWAAFAVWVAACGEKAPLSVEVTTGQEASLSEAPAIALVEIAATSPDETVSLSATAAPGESFDLGEAPDTSILSFELTGTNADGDVVARGRSVSVAVGALETVTLPLFIQRLGSFARPPGGLVRAHVHAPGGVLAERYLIATGGDRAVTASATDADPALGDFYDLLALGAAESGAALPRAAQSMLVRGSALILIDDDGATAVDLTAGTSSDLTAPEGLDFAEVSGGAAIDGPDGISFVVGATREETEAHPKTTAVLVVDDSGSFTVARLATARAGATALYVDGVGLVIAGGAESGSGVETISADGATVSDVPYPADPTTGAAGVVTAAQKIALLGGRSGAEIDRERQGLPGAISIRIAFAHDQDRLRGGEGGAAARDLGQGRVFPASTRVLDLRCVADCEASIVVVEDAALPEVASRGAAFATAKTVLVVGEGDPDGDRPGETLAFSVDLGAATVTPLPLREPRRGATALPTPNGLLAIVGGIDDTGAGASSIELLFPE